MFCHWNNILAFLLLRESAVSEICHLISIDSNDLYYKGYQAQERKNTENINQWMVIFVFFGDMNIVFLVAESL